jgi:transketolase
MLNESKVKELKSFATEIRINTIKQIGKRGFGHVGGAMSIVDLLSVLYDEDMRYDCKNPVWEDRDWLICSKGHAGPAIYSALALKGFFPMEWLDTLNQPNTSLPSHCDRKKTPGIDITTGSLGQGLSVACGIALGNLFNGKESMVYCIIGDGESQEGQNWEAIMFAAQNKLENLILFVDDNKTQLDDYTQNINNMQSYYEKFKSFNWDVAEIDGHDHNAIHNAIIKAKAIKEKPSAIILNTIKGKGCSFAEKMWNHHMTVSQEQMDEALAALMV